MFGFDEVTGIELSVRAENTGALRVYEKAGFKKRHSIRQTRKPLGSRS
jgi:RimJ/RimL family protein N-acetyltransferase